MLRTCYKCDMRGLGVVYSMASSFCVYTRVDGGIYKSSGMGGRIREIWGEGAPDLWSLKLKSGHVWPCAWSQQDPPTCVMS